MKITIHFQSSDKIIENEENIKQYHIGISPFAFTIYDELWKQLYYEKVKSWKMSSSQGVLNIETGTLNPLSCVEHKHYSVRGKYIENPSESVFIFDNAMKIMIKNI